MNGTMLQAFEWHTPGDGRHWKVLYRKARGLRRLGFTSLWLPPAYKGSGGKADVGYGVYDLYDLGEFDQKGTVRTKYGSADEYLELMERLNDLGLHPLADVVLNHRMGADACETVSVCPVDSQDRRHRQSSPSARSIYTRFDFPGRGLKYSEFEWNASRFTGVDWASGEKGVFLIEGKQWAQDVDGELGNYDYLMGADVDVNDPEVRNELIHWGFWMLDTVGPNGFRLDAVKHISAGFYKEWLARIRRHAGREVFAVGEYWSYSLLSILNYLDAVDNTLSLFDAPLHDHLKRAASSNGDYDMRGLFEGTLVGTRPHLAVTFCDNHDTQPGQALESFVDPWFKPVAYALILLRSFGYPCVFWGDLYGIPTHGISKVKELPLLMRLRRDHAYGRERDYFDHPDLIGFTREGDPKLSGSGLAFLCTNRSGGKKRMVVGKRWAGTTWRCVLGNRPPVKIRKSGAGFFSVGDGGFAIWLPPVTLSGLWRQFKTWIRSL